MLTACNLLLYFSSFSTIFSFHFCHLGTCLTNFDDFFGFLPRRRPKSFMEPDFRYPQPFFPPHEGIFGGFHESSPPLRPKLPYMEPPGPLLSRPRPSPAAAACRCRFLQFSSPICPTVFSFFLIDLHASLRYNISIKQAIPQPNNLTFVQTGGNYHESQCQTRIHGPHHQL